jgi:hypothetical protein
MFSFLSHFTAPDSYKVQDKKTAPNRSSSTVSGQNSNHSGHKPGRTHGIYSGKNES